MKAGRFQYCLRANRIDLALLLNLDSLDYNHNMLYFTGYKGIGVFLIPKNKKPFLVVPEMEVERAKKSFNKVCQFDKKRLFESIKQILRKNKVKFRTLGIDYSSININAFRALKKEFKKTKIKDISKVLLDLRKIKDEEELKNLRKSCSIADSIVRKCLKSFKKFRTEKDVAFFLEYEAKKASCGLSFPPIVASGKNASMPHYEPQNIELKKGFCVIDFGVKYRGYCSDITRTVYIGKPSEKEKQIYNFLLKIQNNLIKNIKINKKCDKIYNECVKQLNNYSKYFTHGLGHGVGVEIHELPNLTLNSKDKIENKMVFTIEPGIYVANKFGIRIEDTVLFDKKVSILTKTTKEMVIV